MANRLTRLKSVITEGFSNLDPILTSEKLVDNLPSLLPREGLRRRLLDVLMNVNIPFNRWLGLRIKEITPQTVIVESPATVLRKNHVGTAHACAQALIGEYAAGLLIAQHFPVEMYRVIIGKLEVDYRKAGRGTLYGRAVAPPSWPDTEEDQAWIDMETEITDRAGDVVSVCRTRWQVKTWETVREKRTKK